MATNKPRTIAAAKKAGSKFFYDKNGKKKLAVTAEELKKSGKTLRQWANDWKKPKSSTAVEKSLRPKKRPVNGGSVSATSTKEKAEVLEANKAIKLQIKARKDTGPNSARKAPLKVKLRGAEWMAANTSAAYAALTKSEASALGLPRTRVAAMQSTLRKNKFKDGQGWDYSNPSKKKDPSAGRGGSKIVRDGKLK